MFVSLCLHLCIATFSALSLMVWHHARHFACNLFHCCSQSSAVVVLQVQVLATSCSLFDFSAAWLLLKFRPCNNMQLLLMHAATEFKFKQFHYTRLEFLFFKNSCKFHFVRRLVHSYITRCGVKSLIFGSESDLEVCLFGARVGVSWQKMTTSQSWGPIYKGKFLSLA